MEKKDLLKISEQILLAVKMQKPTSSFVSDLGNMDISSLQNQLCTDNKKKTFWINIYNAFYQILRKEKGLKKPKIYRNKEIRLAGIKVSLDDIEHGILRKYRYKYSLGFFANIFTKRLIKQLAVDTLDYRIHFALNCGAKSCPPIAFYKEASLEQQLDLATLSFLEGESEFDDQKKEVHTTALFQWFLGDFGGISGIKKIFKQHLHKDISDYKIKYKEYSWEEDLDNFVSANS